MDLNQFRSDIKKICLLMAYLQSLSSVQKPPTYAVIDKFGKCFKSLFSFFFALIFYTLTLATIFCFCKFFANSLKSEGERL
jgi:hypothetical protein